MNVIGATSLHLAVIGGDADLVRLLISNNADIEAKNNDGNNIIKVCFLPIHYLSFTHDC